MKKFSDVGFCALFILFVLVIVIAATIENEGVSEDREWFAKEYSDGAIEMGCLRMWDLSEELENRPVKVAVIDTGIDCMNEELTGHIFINPKDFPGNEIDDDGNGYVDDIIGWNFCNNSYSCKACGNNPGNNHGTLVAGIIAANHNSSRKETFQKNKGEKDEKEGFSSINIDYYGSHFSSNSIICSL